MTRQFALRSPAGLPIAVAVSIALSACGGGGGGATDPASQIATPSNADGTLPTSTAPLVEVATGMPAAASAADATDLATAMAATGTDATPAALLASSIDNTQLPSKDAESMAVDPADTTAETVMPTASIQAVRPAATATATATVGATYYIDSTSGNDGNNGLASVAGTAGVGPWRTLAKLATTTLKAGDTVRLICGRTWNETLRLASSGVSGSPITVSSFPAGCSNQPVIDGSVSIPASAWTLSSGSIYKASLTGVPLQVFSAAGPMSIAHHPNAGFDATQPSSVYLRNAATSDSVLLNGRTVSTYLTTGNDLKLPAGAAITAGTKVRIRTLAWLMDERSISAVSGARLSLSSPTTYKLDAGWGYFLLGQRWMLDSAGEWHHDSAAKTLYAWMPDGRAPTNPVQATMLAIGIDLNSRAQITVDNLVVRKASTGMDLRKSSGITVRNSLIEDTLEHGVYAAPSAGLIVSGNRFIRTGTDAISGQEDTTAAATGMQVLNNTLSDIGVTMQGDVNIGLPARSRAAIRTGSGALVEGNTLTNSGYIGVWVGASSTVRNNSIAGTCTVLDDCGGIYTSGTPNNSVISGNMVQNIRGAVAGKPSIQAYTQGQGIYLDELASGVTVSNNTVVNADNGIHVHVAANNTFSGNKLYGNRVSQLWMQENTNRLNALGDVWGNSVNRNQFVPTSATARVLYLESSISDTQHFGSIDYNRYLDSIYPIVSEERNAAARTPYTLATWRAATTANGTPRGLDSNGSGTSQTRYASVLTNGSNIVPNGSIASDLKGWTRWNATAPIGTLTREACAPGWCARYVAGGSPGLVSSPNFSVVAGNWYRLTIDAASGADGQLLDLVVRRGGGGGNGYESLADRSLKVVAYKSFRRFSVIFKATKTVNAADPVTGDLGARLDVQNIASGKTVSVANVEVVPIVQPDAFTRNDILLNQAATATQVACPVAATQPALCANYVRLADDQTVTWPYYLAPRSSEIVYTRDARLVDSDGDGISDNQDTCPATAVGAAVNSRGCALGQ